MSNDPSNPFSGNPYQPSEQFTTAATPQDFGIEFSSSQTRGLVSHTTVLGVLMIIQGVMDLIACVFSAIYAWMMPAMMNQMAQQAAANGQGQPMPPNIGQMFAIGGSVLAAVLFLMGALLIYGGIGVIRFQRRGVAIGALFFGMLTLITCYCFPTSLALGIYGMIVLLNSPVMLAFQLRKQGHLPLQIQQAFLALATQTARDNGK